METLALFLFGLSLLLFSAPSVHLSLLDPVANAYLWQRSSVIAGLLACYGVLFIVLGFWSWRLSARQTSLRAKCFDYSRAVYALMRDDLLGSMKPLAPRRDLGWLIGVIGIGAALRAYFLAQPIRYDEAYTFLNFVNGDLAQLFVYPYPNNHVFHTILVKLATLVFGAHPASIRLPSFLAGVAAIPFTYWAARVLSGRKPAIFATVAMAVFPYLVLYSSIARGYSLVVLLTIVLILVGACTAKTPSIAASIILSVIAALGMLTIPTMAFPIAGIYLWLVGLFIINGNKPTQILSDFVFPSAVMTGGLTVVLYSPVIMASNGITPLLANDYVKARLFDEFFRQIPSHFELTFVDFFRDVPELVLWAGLAFMTLGVYAAFKDRHWAIVLLLPAMLAASAVLIVLKRAIPFPRTWIFLLPIMFLLTDYGWRFCLEFVSQGIRVSTNRAIVLAAACYAVFLISANAIVRYPDTGTFPEAALVAGYLRPIMKNGDKVYLAIPADYPVYFYLWYNKVRDFRGRERSPNRAKFFVVQKSRYRLENIASEPVFKLVELADAVVYENYPNSAPRGYKRHG